MRLFRCAAADLRCMYGFFGLGRNQDDDRDQHKGTAFLRPQDASPQSPSSQLSNSQQETGQVQCRRVVGQQGFFGAGVVERGDQTRLSRGCQGGYPRFLWRAMGDRHTRALQVLVQWRLWAPD